MNIQPTADFYYDIPTRRLVVVCQPVKPTQDETIWQPKQTLPYQPIADVFEKRAEHHEEKFV